MQRVFLFNKKKSQTKSKIYISEEMPENYLGFQLKLFSSLKIFSLLLMD